MQNITPIAFLFLMITTLFFITGCANLRPPEETPYKNIESNARSTSEGVSSINEANETIQLKIPEETSLEEITLSGNAGHSTRAVVNGRAVPVDYNGNFSMPYKLQPGKNDITIEIFNQRGSLVGELTKEVTFTPPPPKLSFALPENTEIEPVAVTGITEPGCIVLVNGIKTMADAKGKFSKYIGLKPGDNTVEVISTNKLGAAAVEQKTITFNPPAPNLSVSIPAYSSLEKMALNGQTAPHTLVEVFVNSTAAAQNFASLAFKGTTGEDGKFTADIKLSEGNNTISVVATGRYGTQATSLGNINFKAGPPKLYVVPIGVSKTESVEISGFTDEDSSVIIYVNGEKAIVNVNDNGKFSARVHLNKDAADNAITVVAQNKWGYSSEETLSIEYIGG